MNRSCITIESKIIASMRGEVSYVVVSQHHWRDRSDWHYALDAIEVNVVAASIRRQIEEDLSVRN